MSGAASEATTDIKQRMNPKLATRLFIELDIELSELTITLTNAAMLSANNATVDGCAPTAFVSAFQIEGNVDLDDLLAGVNEILPLITILIVV